MLRTAVVACLLLSYLCASTANQVLILIFFIVLTVVSLVGETASTPVVVAAGMRKLWWPKTT
jgi:hypothetical protein